MYSYTLFCRRFQYDDVDLFVSNGAVTIDEYPPEQITYINCRSNISVTGTNNMQLINATSKTCPDISTKQQH